VLLIEDGVYAAIAAGKAAASLQGLTVAALGPDLKARGIGDDKLIDGIKIVDYAGFVDLVVTTDRIQSWL
jgi:tRNA 2-thiouridine synthesizing protein B